MLANYLLILKESLEKKLSILQDIEFKSKEQAQMIKDELPFEDIDKNMDDKESLIDELERLDEGFDSLYAKIKSELADNKDQFREEIKTIQDLISKVMETSASIEVIESRNKTAMTNRFVNEKKDLSDKRAISSTAYDYYKTANKLQAVGPQFLDSKQ